MTIILILLVIGLIAWAVAGALSSVHGDGYGLPEIRDRVRHVERRTTA